MVWECKNRTQRVQLIYIPTFKTDFHVQEAQNSDLATGFCSLHYFQPRDPSWDPRGTPEGPPRDPRGPPETFRTFRNFVEKI